MTSAAAPGNDPAPPSESGPPEPGLTGPGLLGGPEPTAGPGAGPAPGVGPAPGTGAAPWQGWAAVCAVSLGIFCLITSELLPVGLLTPVGAALMFAAAATVWVAAIRRTPRTPG
ncbi:hypothetical protein [Streptomyces sp. NBC_01214]|uniref:hypothetical protein n=1 Tax=Streptomyces sp. NBC_01214 TaxID=2903777 RepID=UPI002B1D7D05|nr:hypothetical protein [Streptomyces sp. NBC_01214]